MISRDFADHFARDWIEAWNSHDLDRILAHYTEDFVMSSPYIAQVVGEPSGTLPGRRPCHAAPNCTSSRSAHSSAPIPLRFIIEASEDWRPRCFSSMGRAWCAGPPPTTSELAGSRSAGRPRCDRAGGDASHGRLQYLDAVSAIAPDRRFQP